MIYKFFIFSIIVILSCLRLLHTIDQLSLPIKPTSVMAKKWTRVVKLMVKYSPISDGQK